MLQRGQLAQKVRACLFVTKSVVISEARIISSTHHWPKLGIWNSSNLNRWLDAQGQTGDPSRAALRYQPGSISSDLNSKLDPSLQGRAGNSPAPPEFNLPFPQLQDDGQKILNS